MSPDLFQRVQDFLDSCTPDERRAAILRLMWADNNGDAHFDHGDPGYSWACLRCSREGLGALNGWVGALKVLDEAARRSNSKAVPLDLPGQGTTEVGPL